MIDLGLDGKRAARPVPYGVRNLPMTSLLAEAYRGWQPGPRLACGRPRRIVKKRFAESRPMPSRGENR